MNCVSWFFFCWKTKRFSIWSSCMAQTKFISIGDSFVHHFFTTATGLLFRGVFSSEFWTKTSFLKAEGFQHLGSSYNKKVPTIPFLWDNRAHGSYIMFVGLTKKNPKILVSALGVKFSNNQNLNKVMSHIVDDLLSWVMERVDVFDLLCIKFEYFST